MIYICTALYIEAEPLINKLNLKKDTTINKFQIFKNDETLLIITGKGKIKAAIALTYLLTKIPPTSKDFIINIGLCGCLDKKIKLGDTFLCNKILDLDTKRTYYTDILFKHPFKESNLECSSIECTDSSSIKYSLIDMESSSIYQSAITFFDTHQIYIIKIVSDYLDTDNLNISLIRSTLDKKIPPITSWIKTLNTYNYNPQILDSNDTKAIAKLSSNLKLSCTMENQLIQIIKYYKLIHGNFNAIIHMLSNIHCKSKKEGKKYLEQIRTKFI